MKLVRVVLTLTVVVVLFSAMIFFVEGITTPIIDAENARIANEAKAEVLPSLADYPNAVESVFDQYDVGDTGITDIFVVPGYGYVYQAEFQGYQSIIVYMIGINEDGEVTGYKTLQQGDTPGLGAEIGNPANWTQFAGLSLDNAAAGNFDGLAGATVTTTAWKASLARVISFHNNEMLGFVVTDVTSSYTLPDGVTKVELVGDGTNDLYVVYYAEFESQYSSGPNTFVVSINLADGSIKKFEVTNATDSDGIGAAFGESEFAEQFKNLAQEDVLAGNYDVQAGASYPITFSAFNTVFEDLYLFHRVEFEGYTPPQETEEEKLARWKEELSVEDAVITDVSGNYDLSSTVITKVEETDDTHLLITMEFTGYNENTPVVVLFGIDVETNALTGMRVISQSETNGLGGKIEEEDYLAQFDGLSGSDAQSGTFDAIAGATVTTTGLKDAFEDAINFYNANLVQADSEIVGIFDFMLKAYPTMFTFDNISSDYTLDHGIDYIFTPRDISGNILGYVFYVSTDGAGYTDNSSITYLLAINEDETFKAFSLIGDTETPGRADPYYVKSYWNQFVGVDINATTYPVDAVAGSTHTHNAILTSVGSVADFFLLEVFESRPDPIAASDSMLLQGFSGVDHFESVYLANPYNEFIGNVYEAFDASNNSLGYVFIGLAQGNGGTIYYAWGVDNTGQTQQFGILVENESWSSAPDYTGGETFATNTFTAHYEDIQMDTLLANPANIDAYAGVSITTSGVVESVEAIVQYYIDNFGGGN